MKRSEFIRIAAPAFLLLANGNILRAEEYLLNPEHRRKVRVRFAIGSDSHYGELLTNYKERLTNAVTHINQEHAREAFSFCMINGDIVHNDKVHYEGAKSIIDGLTMPYYVSQGNHDMVTPEEWLSIWKMPVNFDFSRKDTGFLVGTTSNEKGDYICPDLVWMEAALKRHRHYKDVFIFLHINPVNLTANAVDCKELPALLAKYKNVRAVFNGHDHNLDGVKMKDGIPYIFDSHIGGSWGTSYHGFRIVELMKDGSILTYIMDPDKKINEAQFDKASRLLTPEALQQ